MLDSTCWTCVSRNENLSSSSIFALSLSVMLLHQRLCQKSRQRPRIISDKVQVEPEARIHVRNKLVVGAEWSSLNCSRVKDGKQVILGPRQETESQSESLMPEERSQGSETIKSALWRKEEEERDTEEKNHQSKTTTTGRQRPVSFCLNVRFSVDLSNIMHHKEQALVCSRASEDSENKKMKVS